MHIEDEKPSGLTNLSKAILAFSGFLLGLLLSRIFLFMPFIVQDNSMMPGLNKGDYIIILKILSPEPGDIVLVKSPADPERMTLKRLIAIGAGNIEIKDRNFFINQKSVKFNWQTLSKDSRRFPTGFSRRDNLPDMELKDGELFLIGDNLDYSFDSRDFGPVSRENLIGKVIF